jgi:ABC-type uncharacterized transport system permease subunit|tara:strand:+ start:1143 stop:1940 length:798 start_codon:yes stop_codon:yes gene_type:complete
MLMITLGVAASLCYLAATGLQIQRVLKDDGTDGWVKLLGALAVILHGFTAYKGFVNTSGYDLGIYPMLSLMSLSIGTIVLISSLQRSVDNLFIFVFPLAISTIILQVVLKGDYTPRDDITGGIFSHIALSIIAYSLLTIAATQALLLSFGDNMLRQRQLTILKNLPPLETMEHLMFEVIWAGLVFLTLSIASGFFFLGNFSEPGLVHHTAITLAAWFVFMLLAWGRYQLGWRGAIASRWTLFGFILLALGYFGSKLVIEVILGIG